MIQINNQEKFNETVKDALAKSKNFPRWQNAITKAVLQIELQPEFITWMPETKSIIIWSQTSNEVHAANGVCGCIAFEKGFPCYHRAMARLIRLYMESEDAPVVAEVQLLDKDTPYFSGGYRKERKLETLGGVRF